MAQADPTVRGIFREKFSRAFMVGDVYYFLRSEEAKDLKHSATWHVDGVEFFFTDTNVCRLRKTVRKFKKDYAEHDHYKYNFKLDYMGYPFFRVNGS